MSGILTSNLSRTSGHRKRRYSARPFYLTILIFTVLTTASWIWGDVGVRSGISLPYQVQRQTGPGAHLLRRDGAPEVLHALLQLISSASQMDHADIFYFLSSVAWFETRKTNVPLFITTAPTTKMACYPTSSSIIAPSPMPNPLRS